MGLLCINPQLCVFGCGIRDPRFGFMRLDTRRTDPAGVRRTSPPSPSSTEDVCGEATVCINAAGSFVGQGSVLRCRRSDRQGCEDSLCFRESGRPPAPPRRQRNSSILAALTKMHAPTFWVTILTCAHSNSEEWLRLIDFEVRLFAKLSGKFDLDQHLMQPVTSESPTPAFSVYLISPEV